MNRARALSQLSTCLRGEIPQNADWVAILTLANQHWVTAELCVSLRSAPEAPEEVQVFLREVYARNRQRNASLFATLTDALMALNAEGVAPVLLKGCATWVAADEVKPSDSGRTLSDLDLLTRPDEFENAVGALTSAGFEIVEDNRGQTHHPVVVMLRQGDRGTIDLHKFPPGRPSDTGALLADCIPVRCGGSRAYAPTAERQILTLTLHDQILDGDYWLGGFHLRHLIDIARLTKAERGIDWARLFDSCPSETIRSALKVELMAAKRIAGAEVPREVFSRVWTDAHYWRERLQYALPISNVPLRWMGRLLGWPILPARSRPFEQVM